MTRIIVLGVTGMIGHKVYQVISSDSSFDVIGVSRRLLNPETIVEDLRNLSNLKKLLKKIKPDFVINCSGLLIEDSERRPIDAIKLNALLPLSLQKLSKEFKFKFTQISTDCVFSGENGPYSEYDEKDATNIYGKTKSLSEVNDNRNLTIRTSVIGPDYYNDGFELFHWFMNQTDEIFGYKKSLWSGVTTLELAKAIKWSIENEVYGLRNLTSGIPISKYQLLNIINDKTKRDLKITPTDGPAHNKALVDSYEFFYKTEVNYEKIIQEMIDDIVSRKSDYPHYEIF